MTDDIPERNVRHKTYQTQQNENGYFDLYLFGIYQVKS